MNRSKFRIVLCAGILTVSWAAASPALAETKQKVPAPAPTDQTTTTETEAIPPVEPGKVKELAEQAGVAPAQVTSMRTSGLGWGEIKIAISLAQKISTAQTTALPITPILDGLLAQRQAGMGWGEIAQANGFKLGEVVGKGQAKKDATVVPVEPVLTTPETSTGAKPDRGSKLDKPEKMEKPAKLDKPERPEKPEKPEKLDKPERPEKVEKPEKPERPEKPEKPEKPQRTAK